MRIHYRSALLVLSLLLFLTAASSWCAAWQQPTPEAATATPAHGLVHYTLPADKLEKARALYVTQGTLYFLTTAWSFLVLYLMLRTRFGVRLRNFAESTSRFRIVQAAIVMSLFVLVLELTQLPFDLYEHSLGLKYGLSVQSWGSWFADWGKSLLLEFLFVSFLGWILYAVLRRSPRRWWFYFWLALIPIVVFVLFVEPVWVEPLFDKFQPLNDHHPELVTQIERVVHRGGMDIPPQRMFEMKASEKRTTLNAYVTGFGSTKRVVVWDTTMERMTTPETLFVFGHEMGHYVLGHIPKMLAIFLLIFLALFYAGYRLAHWMLHRWGESWGIRDLADWASLPMLVLIISVLTFIASPLLNTVSRHYEHQADQYGLEVVHGLVPDPSTAAAQAFQILGERSLDYPDVGRLAEIWRWDHPTIRDRMIFVQTYDPWGEGKSPEFVKGRAINQ
jgi:STE24 endopeptidase